MPESKPVTLPSGKTWTFNTVLSHAVKRTLDHVGRGSSYVAIKELQDAGLKVDELLAGLDPARMNQAQSKALSVEQREALVLHATIRWDYGPVDRKVLDSDDFDDRDFEFMAGHLEEHFGLGDHDDDQGGKEPFAPPSGSPDSPPDLTAWAPDSSVSSPTEVSSSRSMSSAGSYSHQATQT